MAETHEWEGEKAQVEICKLFM